MLYICDEDSVHWCLVSSWRDWQLCLWAGVESCEPCRIRWSSFASVCDAPQLVAARSPSTWSHRGVVAESTGASQCLQRRHLGTFHCHLVGQHGYQIQKYRKHIPLLGATRRYVTWPSDARHHWSLNTVSTALCTFFRQFFPVICSALIDYLFTIPYCTKLWHGTCLYWSKFTLLCRLA